MKIFKKKAWCDLNDQEFKDILYNETFVCCKKGDKHKFEVWVKEKTWNQKGEEISSNGTYSPLGIFHNLKQAIAYAQFYEGAVYKYEYYIQKQEKAEKEGPGGSNMQVMGDLGWELCAIDGRDFYYKRIKIN